MGEEQRKKKVREEKMAKGGERLWRSRVAFLYINRIKICVRVYYE